MSYQISHHKYEVKASDFSLGSCTDLATSVWFQKNLHYKTERRLIRHEEEVQVQQVPEEAKIQSSDGALPFLDVYGDE